jgi:hypothetical protein
MSIENEFGQDFSKIDDELYALMNGIFRYPCPRVKMKLIADT